MSGQIDDDGSTVTRPIAPGGFTTPVGGDLDIDDAAASNVVPNLAASMPVGERFAVGLSVTKPFHLEYDYGDNAWTRYDTTANEIDATDIQVTGAMRATPWLDLGVGFSAQYTEAFLDSAYPNLDPTAPDARASLQGGDGWNYGWTAGAQAHLDRLSLGASYRSAMNHEIDGTFTLSGLLGPLAGGNFSAPAQTSFKTPWLAIVAARWQATPQLTLNGQVQRSGWSEYDAVRVTIGGQPSAIVQNFSDTTSVAVGADYALTPVWTIRAGVQFDPTPVADELREPGIADSDRWVYGLGASVVVNPAVTFDAALGYVAFQGDRIYENAVFYPGTGADTTVRMRGSYEADSKIVSAGLRWRF
jgi:long-chain fatty acid transport protein